MLKAFGDQTTIKKKKKDKKMSNGFPLTCNVRSPLLSHVRVDMSVDTT
jgi:gluconate kinase